MHPLALLLWLAAVLALATQGLDARGRRSSGHRAQRGVRADPGAPRRARGRGARAYLPPARHRGPRRPATQSSTPATIVPGDLLVVEEGDAVCADAELRPGAVEVDMSAVTGESVPVVRSAAASADRTPRTRLVDAHDVVLSGTTCTSGEAVGRRRARPAWRPSSDGSPG